MQLRVAQHVGERLRRGASTSEIRTDDQLMIGLRSSIHIQVLQCEGGLSDLPFPHGIQRNIHLPLQAMRRIVGGAPVTDEENGTYMMWHGNPSYP